MCMQIAFFDDPKARLSRTETIMPNNVGASTHPCFTPLLIDKGFDTEFSN
jgi:hypothetical protein